MSAVSELPAEALLHQLADLLGDDGVITDHRELEYYSADVYSAGVTAALAIAPVERDRLAAAVRLITDAGYAVIPRGGGMSYTSGYTPVVERSVIVDLGRLDKIVDIDANDMTISPVDALKRHAARHREPGISKGTAVTAEATAY